MAFDESTLDSRLLLSGRFWLNDPALINRTKESLRVTGAATLDQFLSPSALRSAVKEAREKADSAFVSESWHNVYLVHDDDPSFAEDHVRNRKLKTTVASIAADELSPKGTLHRLYFGSVGDELISFLSKVIGKQLYRLADPLGAVSINVFKPSMEHAYHFDESEYTVTLCLQKPTDGGEFMFTLPIRDSRDDLAAEKVEHVVQTDEGVRQLPFEPGTLAIFNGSRSLHCVRKVGGNEDRLVAVLCFSTEPGVKNSADVQKQFWGRSAL